MNVKLDAGKQTRNYSVEKRIEIHDCEHDDVAKFTEEIDVTIDRTLSSAIAKIVRSNVKKDGCGMRHNPLDHYMIKSGEVLNKLDLQLSTEGRIEKVLNREEILKNWRNTKIYLDHYFVSDDTNVVSTIKEWTQQIDSIVKNEDLFLRSVQSDFLYHRLFYGYWLDYGHDNKLIKTSCIPGLFGNAITVMDEELTLAEKDEKRLVEIKGSLNKDLSDISSIASSLQIMESQINDLTVGLKGTCQLDAHGIVEKIDLNIVVEVERQDLKRNYCLIVRYK